MLDAPRQNWTVYKALTAEHDRRLLKNLSMAERFARYQDLFQLVCGQRRSEAEQARLEKSRWQQKLALREKQNRAFGSLL